jgi:hypothetical protein
MVYLHQIAEHKFICIAEVQFLDKDHILKYGLFEGKNREWKKKKLRYIWENRLLKKQN